MTPRRCTPLGAGAIALALGLLFGPPAWAAPKGKSRVHVVVMENMQFSPPDLKVRKGDAVEWINKDLVPHTATANDGAFDSSGIQPGQKWRVRMARTGDIAYVCRFHPTMLGTVTVE